jgi:hypothetical protein
LAFGYAVLIKNDLGKHIRWTVKPSFQLCLVLREIPSDWVSIDDGPGFNQVDPDRHDCAGADISASGQPES